MSKTDKLKEEVGWLKVIFGILVATDISLVAWIAQHAQEAGILILISCGVAVLIITTTIIGINKMAYRKIDELGDL